MSVVAVWRLFAFMDGDEAGTHDERRLLADWQIHDAVRWCVTRGYDHIYLSRSTETARFEKKPSPEGVTHYGIRGAVDGDHESAAESEGSVA